MESLQHDPRIKQQIKDVLYEFLYEPVQKQAKTKLDTIIQQNCVALNSPHESFIYQGVVYSTNNGKLPRKMNRLVPQLHPQMEDYLNDMKQLNEYELPYVLGFVNQVLNSSNDLHDYLRVLPASVHQPIQDLIATCPCRTIKLPQDKVETLQQKNELPIQLMKKRLLLNVLM